MHCAVLPYVGQSNRGERWVDTGSELPGGFDNRVYLSSSGVRAAMDALGWPAPGEARQARAERDAALERVRALEAEVAEARRQLDAVHVLKQAGFAAERKRGPKAREETTA
jgi:hypothetical protein